MTKPKLVRIDPDVLEAIIKLAKENDRSIPRQINRMLREHPDACDLIEIKDLFG